jgi:hypothetical protein
MLHVINLEALETHVAVGTAVRRKLTGYDGVVRRSLGRLVGAVGGGVGRTAERKHRARRRSVRLRGVFVLLTKPPASNRPA